MSVLERLNRHAGYRVVRFALRRGIIILATIFLGVFITVVAANRSGQIEASLSEQVYAEATRIFRESDYWEPGLPRAQREAYVDAVYEQLAEEAGLELPFLQRHLRWTWNALTFQWGDIQFRRFSALGGNSSEAVTVSAAIASRVPNTLLLIGPANLLVFLMGLPLALYLSRNLGKGLDRFFALLAPLSSIPSWVIGLVLVLLFAVQVHWLPIGGKTGIAVDLEGWAYAWEVFQHMVLPVSAIVISLLFQFVYTWRSYFLVYADEDYVELARAMGLSDSLLERKHILRPTLPFIITSFSLSLVSFWQTTIALEVVFNWPGIGKLYIDSLPQFDTEGLFPGDLVITIALVTIFAYLLGFTILLLEIIYAMVDPRVQIDSAEVGPARKRKSLLQRLREWRKVSRPPPPRPALSPLTEFDYELPEGVEIQVQSDARMTWQRFLRELRRFPTAIVGLVIIAFLALGSLYAFIFLPYGEVGLEWYSGSVTGSTYVPKTAAPEWTNVFRREPLLSQEIYDSRLSPPQVSQSFAINEAGAIEEEIHFTFDYDYGEVPEEAFVYFNTRYEEKRPFAFWTLIRPDGREVELSAVTPLKRQKVQLEEQVFSGPRARQAALDEFPALSAIPEGEQALYYLFGDLEGEEARPLQGQYQLVINGLTFEPDSWIESELVLLGQVYGSVGTDIFRRDLLVPLMWGMPFAMSIGLMGALFTVTVSLFAAAAGVWIGGWVDSLVERLSDINMVLPILAISVILYIYYGLNLWLVLAIIVLFGAFGSPTKSFRAAFLQIKEEPYIESARAYGASNWRIITRYLVPRIMPVLIPQLITLVPGFVFLEATMGLFNIRTVYPTWGRVIYEALRYGISWGSRYWVFEPLALLLLTGFAFAMIGFAMDRIFNPRQDYG